MLSDSDDDDYESHLERVTMLSDTESYIYWCIDIKPVLVMNRVDSQILYVDEDEPNATTSKLGQRPSFSDP